MEEKIQEVPEEVYAKIDEYIKSNLRKHEGHSSQIAIGETVRKTNLNVVGSYLLQYCVDCKEIMSLAPLSPEQALAFSKGGGMVNVEHYLVTHLKDEVSRLITEMEKSKLTGTDGISYVLYADIRRILNRYQNATMGTFGYENVV